MTKVIDLTGKKFGRLTVIKQDKESKRTKWICKCECGNIKSVYACHLKDGSSTSCGCFQKEKVKQSNSKHGYTKTSLHNRWKTMKQRCCNKNDKNYKNYGGRGITVCDEWNDFENFKNWALLNGYEQGLQLDRIDNNKGYSPDNCRWCKASVNNHNRRNTAKIDGIPLTDFAEIHNLTYSHIHYIYYRLINGNIIPNTENVLKYANQLPINNENC